MQLRVMPVPAALPSFIGVIGLFIGAAACGGPTLRLDKVTPSPVAPGAELTVEGEDFADGLDLALVNATVNVRLQHVVVGGAGKASATVPAAAPAGTYKLRATLGAATADLDGVRVVAGGMQVHFIDVGQGDATIVIAPGGETLLIDGGPPEAAQTLADAVRDIAGGRIDAVVLTHYHADHLGGLVPLLAGPDGNVNTDDDVVPPIRYAYVDDDQCTSNLCARARGMRSWPWDVPGPGDAFALGEVDVELVTADGDAGDGRVSGVDDPNERSIAVLLSFGGRTVLVEGDLTGGGDGEANVELPTAEHTGAVDVLRSGHHGSSTSSNPAALSTWAPRAVILSLGTDNDFCHPARDALAHLAATGAHLYATGDGMVGAAASDCGGPTPWPDGARHGLGTIDLLVGLDGALTIAGDAL